MGEWAGRVGGCIEGRIRQMMELRARVEVYREHIGDH